jgi:hypothetical protein
VPRANACRRARGRHLLRRLDYNDVKAWHERLASVVVQKFASFLPQVTQANC